MHAAYAARLKKLPMAYQKDHFPVLSIQEFSEGKTSGQPMLYHEIRGERFIEEPHKHDFFIAILFEKGKGTHTIDFTEYKVGRHQLHLVFPQQVHAWRLKKDTVGYQLMIGREQYEAFLPSLRFTSAFYERHPVLNLDEASYTNLLYEFKTLRQELGEKEIFRELITARTTVVGLLISKAAESIFQDVNSYSANPLLARFLRLIDVHFKEERSVAFYAKELNISPNYLNIICNKALHASASSLIQNRVLIEAKRLLKASEMSVKEIVFDLGFYDHANFSKFFKAHTGMSPSAFKELQ